MKGHQNAVVIGGGYIELEVAASLTKAGIHVDGSRMMERVLAGWQAPTYQLFFANLHENHNVGIHTGAINRKS